MTILQLSEADLDALNISTQDVIASVEAVIRSRAEGRTWCAPKAVMLPPDGRYMMAALAATDDPPLLAVKTVILNPANAGKGLPLINGIVTMLDSQTGAPVAVVDGNWVTAVRTAGLSAVAAKTLARPDSAVAAFIGSGVQAQSHLRAFASMFPLRGIRIFGRGRPNIDALATVATALGLAAEVCDSAELAMAEADIIVSSLTRAPGRPPFLDAATLRPGSFTSVVDLAEPWIPDSLAAFDRIVIDDLEQEAAMPTKLVRPDLVTGDLSGLVLGTITGRTTPQERTAFIFRGHALGDLALSVLAYRRATGR